MKFLAILVIIFATFNLSTSARANGVREGASIAAKIAKDLNGKVLECTSATDKIRVEADSKGDLRMIAHYSGSISGQLDTDNEGSGEECGGLSVKTDDKTSSFILDDDYNDCERGDWGYRIAIPEGDLSSAKAESKGFQVIAHSTDQDQEDAEARTLECQLQ